MIASEVEGHGFFAGGNNASERRVEGAILPVQSRHGDEQSELLRVVGWKLSTLTDEWIRSGVAKPLQR